MGLLGRLDRQLLIRERKEGPWAAPLRGLDAPKNALGNWAPPKRLGLMEWPAYLIDLIWASPLLETRESQTPRLPA
jgi:hypothetical protein